MTTDCLMDYDKTATVDIRNEDGPNPMQPNVRTSIPRYRLTLEVGQNGDPHVWRFKLQPSDGHRVVAVEDREPDMRGEQLELLTLIRGLEALDQPSHVVAYGCSRYLRHGVTYGLPEWRENGWQWERFGQMVAINHVELWQRLDRAMQIHQFVCGVRRVDSSHEGPNHRHRHFERKDRVGVRVNFVDWVKYCTQTVLFAVARVVPQPS